MRTVPRTELAIAGPLLETAGEALLAPLVSPPLTAHEAAGLDLVGLLAHLDLQPETVVVEHNRQIVRRNALAGVPVSQGDTVEIVHFVGGG